jgi:hypothetical protein
MTDEYCSYIKRLVLYYCVKAFQVFMLPGLLMTSLVQKFHKSYFAFLTKGEKMTDRKFFFSLIM